MSELPTEDSYSNLVEHRLRRFVGKGLFQDSFWSGIGAVECYEQ